MMRLACVAILAALTSACVPPAGTAAPGLASGSAALPGFSLSARRLANNYNTGNGN